MNNKQAIEAMQFYKEKLYNGIFNKYIEAFDIAISALKKQIPKKPNITRKNFVCPNCNVLLMGDSPFCKYCGQALDWK